MARSRSLYRAARTIALPAVVLVIAGCGSTTTVTVSRSNTTTASSGSASTVPGWGGATTSPVQLPLPFDSEENAFMGNPDAEHGNLHRTGCFADVATFDAKSEEVCDCAYRQLRADGYPASQLASVAADVNGYHNVGPAWFATTITKCWADLDGNS